MNTNYSPRKIFKSFTFAFNGLKIFFRKERNAAIHLVIAIGVIIAGFCLHLSKTEWICIIFAISFVFSAELINTAIEQICDFIHPDRSEQIKRIKDLSAAAVLFLAIAAAIIGLIIFIPKVFELFS